MRNKREMLDYYRKVYEKWYSWFSYMYDPFIKTFCFIFNRGFGGERRWRELIVEWIDPQPGEKIWEFFQIVLAEK